MKIKLKLQFIFYDRIPLILSVINVFSPPTRPPRKDKCMYKYESSECRPVHHLTHGLFDEFLYESLCLLETIWIRFYTFLILVLGRRTLSMARHEREARTCAICQNTNFLTIFFLFRVKYYERQWVGWGSASKAGWRWKNNKHTASSIHFHHHQDGVRLGGEFAVWMWRGRSKMMGASGNRMAKERQ